MGSAVALLDDVTAPDAVGPTDVPSRLPGAEARIVARQAGPLRAGAD